MSLFSHFQEPLYPAKGCCGSWAYPGNTGHELGIHPGWDAVHCTHAHSQTLGTIRGANLLPVMFCKVGGRKGLDRNCDCNPQAPTQHSMILIHEEII